MTAQPGIAGMRPYKRKRCGWLELERADAQNEPGLSYRQADRRSRLSRDGDWTLQLLESCCPKVAVVTQFLDVRP